MTGFSAIASDLSHAVSDDGWICPVTDMLDDEGEHTLDPDDAVVIIVLHPAGWVVIDLRDFDEDETLH